MYDMTLGEIVAKNKSAQQHIYQGIRNRGHRILEREGRKKICHVCGYTKGIQVCHVKGIATFAPHTKIITINASTNLVYLCPNHHWELDHEGLVIQI